MAKRIAPYGSWASPITIDDAASTADAFFGYTIVDFDDRGVLWLEARPAEPEKFRVGQPVTVTLPNEDKK